MSRFIKCDKCGEAFKVNERRPFQLYIANSSQIPIYLCKKCLRNFFTEYLDFVYSWQEDSYIPKEKKGGE